MKQQKSNSNKLTATKKSVKRTIVEVKKPNKKLVTVGVPGLFEPNEHDIYDELSRLEAFSMRNYY
jgi:hypothetical protein